MQDDVAAFHDVAAVTDFKREFGVLFNEKSSDAGGRNRPYRLENLLPRCERPRFVGRDASASPATGSYAIHLKEQERLVKEALTI